MSRKVKKGSLLEFAQCEEAIVGPSPNGHGSQVLASAGDWASYARNEDGELIFKGFVSEKDYREKFVSV